MKRGTKIFVFITAMLLTVAGLKATIGHRYGYGQYRGGCYNERMHHRNGMGDCPGDYKNWDNKQSDMKNNDITPIPKDVH